MSKLGCVCGHTIVDQTNDIPYKAKFIRDQDFESLIEYAGVVASFADAVKDGKRDEWILNYFKVAYSASISNADVIFDITSGYTRDFESEIFQCENCGRIKIQVRDTNSFASFMPEDDLHRNIFKKFERKGRASND
jgi:hypothetical protein